MTNRRVKSQVGWLVILVVSSLLQSASLAESTSGTNASIVVTTLSKTVNTNSSVLMVCVAHGNPAPTVGWQLRDSTITNCTSQRHTIYEREVPTEFDTTFKESILEICGTEHEDSGEYLCTANNQFSSVSAANTTNLTVLPPVPEPSSVSIVVTTPSVMVNEGSTVLLVCVAYGSPEPPSIKWQLNGGFITNGTSCQHTIYERRIKSNQTAGNFYFTESILEVCDVSVLVSGEYLCTASVGNATASATNATVVTVLSEAPPQPVNCSSIPVYNEEGTLVSIDFSWSQVDVSEKVAARSSNNLNITNFTVSVNGIGSHRVPAEMVCQNKTLGSCSYSYPIPSSVHPASGVVYARHVAAENVAGSGPTCSLTEQQTSVQISSLFLTVSADLTNPNTKMVECSQPETTGGGGGESFNCEFCYSLGQSCQNFTTCADPLLAGRSVSLPGLSGGRTYCYRTRAIVNGSPTMIIQDTITISSCSNTSTNTGLSESSGSAQSTTFSLPVTASISSVIALIVGVLIGCLFGVCLVYLCSRGRVEKKLTPPPALDSSVGFHVSNVFTNDNTINTLNKDATILSTYKHGSAVDTTNDLTLNSAYGQSNAVGTSKDLTLNYAYGRNRDVTAANADQDTDGSTLVDGEAPEYEEMEKVRQTYFQDKNEIELVENHAYSVADAQDDIYDNDND